MKAIVCERYGPPEVLKVREVPKPEAGDNEILIRARATTVNSGDVRIRSRRVPRGFGIPMRLALGWSGPRQPILGLDLAGDVEAVGKDVTRFKPGDRVFGCADFAMRCHAEWRVLPADGAVAAIPEELSYEEAAALCFGGTTALSFFRRGRLHRGETLLVNGASGAVGTAAVQIARHLGAKVTGVCSTANLELVRSLGAERVIDYTSEDFTASDRRYDLIMDTVGNAPYARVKHLLEPGGRYLMVVGDLWPTVQSAFQKQVVAGPAGKEAINAETLGELAELACSGELRPVIDRTYPFEEIVEAHRHVDSGRKRGSVVVTVGAEG